MIETWYYKKNLIGRFVSDGMVSQNRVSALLFLYYIVGFCFLNFLMSGNFLALCVCVVCVHLHIYRDLGSADIPYPDLLQHSFRIQVSHSSENCSFVQTRLNLNPVFPNISSLLMQQNLSHCVITNCIFVCSIKCKFFLGREDNCISFIYTQHL